MHGIDRVLFLAVVVLFFWQSRKAKLAETKLARSTAAIIRHLDEQWAALEDTRGKAAALLLAQNPKLVQLFHPDLRARLATPIRDQSDRTYVDDVLHFFESIALLVERGALDDETVWSKFYFALAPYWSASRDYLRQVHANAQSSAWLSDLDTLTQRLMVIDGRHRGRSPSPPSQKEAEDFLLEEHPNPLPDFADAANS